jgi:hypothetical protein
VIGAILNAVGILLGAGLGLAWRGALNVRTEAFCKSALAAFTAFFGLRLVWLSLSGSLLAETKQVLIILLAGVLGGLLGRGLRLQSLSNQLGRRAVGWISAAQKNPPGRAQDGFLAATILFCAAPLGVIGSVADGLSGYFPLLAVKALMDGLATAGFVRLFRWPVALAAGPVWLFLTLLTLLVHNHVLPFLEAHRLADSVSGAAGLLACLVTLVILGARRVELAGYLPALAVAPALATLLS